MARWRSFPDMVSHPRVNWAPHAARRAGWHRAPIHPERTLVGTEFLGGSGDVQAAPPVTPPDTINVAFIRIEFQNDRGGSESSGDGRFDLSTPGDAAPPIDRPPHNRSFYMAHHEALARYYDTQSYGRVVIRGEVWPRDENGAYHCTDMADFGPWAFSQGIYRAAVNMFRSMIFAADTQSVKIFNDQIPWDQFDRIVLIHAGSDLQSDVLQDSKEDIPSFTIGVGDTDVVIFPRDTVMAFPIDRASIVPETINQDGYYGAINGVCAHECGHLMFGFADLYDVNTGLPRVGLWSLMDSGNLVGSKVVLQDQSILFATGLLPPSIDPWQRAFVGDALHFREVDWGSTITL